MSDSIVNELIAENTYLRQEIEKLTKRNISDTVEVETLSDFSVVEELADKLRISGILLAEGVWNGVLYSKEEIKKMYKIFKDKLSKLPVRIEHERDDDFGSKAVGQHTNVEWSDTLGAILYEAEITDPKAIEELKNGRFVGTSLKLYLKKENVGGVDKGIDLEPVDNSLTSAPACESCIIVNAEELNKSSESSMFKFFGVIKEMNKNDDVHTENKEEINMSEENTEKESQENSAIEEIFELKQDMVAVLPILKPREREVELEFMPADEAIKNHRVIYGFYPAGKYPVSKKRAKVKIYYYYYPTYGYPHYGYPYYYPKSPKEGEEEKSYPKYYYYPQYGYPEKYEYPYYPQYPVPQYYYSYHNEYPSGPRSDKERLIAHFGRETAEKLLDLIGDLAYKLLPPRGTGGAHLTEELEDIEELGEYKIVRNKQTGKYIVMEKQKDGRMKILKQFDSKEEAEKYIASLNIAAGNLSRETEKQSKKFKCPVCGEEFDTKEEMIDHFNKEHADKYGKYGEGKYPEPEKQSKNEKENSEESLNADIDVENENSETDESEEMSDKEIVTNEENDTEESAQDSSQEEPSQEQEQKQDTQETKTEEQKPEDDTKTQKQEQEKESSDSNKEESEDVEESKEEESTITQEQAPQQSHEKTIPSPAEIAKMIAEKGLIADMLIADFKKRREAQI